MPQRRATLKTLATHLGLSVSAVSRALKDSPDIGRDTIALVKRAAEELGYVPDTHAIKLRTGKTSTIVFLKAIFGQQDVPDMDIPFQLEGIAEELTDTPYQLQVMAWNPDSDATPLLSRIVSGRLADGILLDNTMPYDPRVRLLIERHVPFVTFGRTELLAQHAYVDADNEKAAFDATAYLIGRGHTRIALIGPNPRFTYALQRRRGYLRALEAAGLAVDPALIIESGESARACRARMPLLVNAALPPTGFVSSSEPTTFGILAGLRDAGWRYGDDFEIVSRDGLSVHDYLTPPLPSCSLNLRTAARLFCRFLLRHIEGEPVENLQCVLPCDLVVPGTGVRSAD